MQETNRMERWCAVMIGVLCLGPAVPAVGQTPLLKLETSGANTVMQVDANGGLVGLGIFGQGAIPATGAGTRLLWWPGRDAFRVGTALGSEWNDASVGTHSLATGYNTTASGSYATAMGSGATASGGNSMALGTNTAASANYAMAMGNGTTASGMYSTAMGLLTTATGQNSTAMGGNTTAQAFGSLALGRYNIVAGTQASWVASDPVLVVGNGTAATPSNAFTLLKNGDLTIAGRLASGNSVATGAQATALGGANTASGLRSVALGYNTSASAAGALAFGNVANASGSYATAMGDHSVASGDLSTAVGAGSATASGYGAMAFGIGVTAGAGYSTALGLYTTTTGTQATAMGSYTTAQAYASTVMGRYNVLAGSMTSWVATDPLLVVGNGTASVPANAFTLLKNGNLTIAGTLTQNSDARLKEEIQPLGDVLATLGGIRGVTFRWQDAQAHPAGRQVGLLAQEVQQAFPELVHEDSEGHLSVAYGNFSAVLLEAIKEQQREIQRQRGEIDALRERLAALEREAGAQAASDHR